MIGAVRYRAPTSIDEAIEILAQDAGAVVLGGGTWVTPQLVRRERTATTIVDTMRLGIGNITSQDGSLRIGAAVTYSDLMTSEAVAVQAKLLAQMAAGITGGVQVRNQATIGGSACYAAPSSDVPGCLVALQAVLALHGPEGIRRVAAEDFFLDAYRTTLCRDELLVDIVVPAERRRWGYHKLKLNESSWPIATAAATSAAGGGVWITLGAAVRRPVRFMVDAEADIGPALNGELDDPWEDVLAPAEYRRSVAPVVARRAWRQLDQQQEARDEQRP